MEIITYVLSAIIIILLIIVLSMLLAIKKKDKDTKTTDMLTELKFQNESISKNLSNEFERNRRETAGFQNRVVDEMFTEFISKRYENSPIPAEVCYKPTADCRGLSAEKATELALNGKTTEEILLQLMKDGQKWQIK